MALKEVKCYACNSVTVVALYRPCRAQFKYTFSPEVRGTLE